MTVRLLNLCVYHLLIVVVVVVIVVTDKRYFDHSYWPAGKHCSHSHHHHLLLVGQVCSLTPWNLHLSAQ